MSARFDEEFARRYAGRHDPDDAIFWLDRPDQRGPSGADPTQALFLRLEERLRCDGWPAVADCLLVALAELLSADRRAALDAADQAAAVLRQRARSE